MALEPITSRTITDLTGARGRMLHELCNSLGVGSTKQGTERHFSTTEAALLMLAARLIAQGFRRSQAIAVALVAKDDVARFVRDPEADARWLLVSQNDDGHWNTEVADASGSSPDVYDHAGSQSYGYIVVNLRTLAHDVLTAAGTA
jgi:hypothetical protein